MGRAALEFEGILSRINKAIADKLSVRTDGTRYYREVSFYVSDLEQILGLNANQVRARVAEMVEGGLLVITGNDRNAKRYSTPAEVARHEREEQKRYNAETLQQESMDSLLKNAHSAIENVRSALLCAEAQLDSLDAFSLSIFTGNLETIQKTINEKISARLSDTRKGL